MALLYFQPSADCTGASQTRSVGMVGGIDALAADLPILSTDASFLWTDIYIITIIL